MASAPGWAEGREHEREVHARIEFGLAHAEILYKCWKFCMWPCKRRCYSTCMHLNCICRNTGFECLHEHQAFRLSGWVTSVIDAITSIDWKTLESLNIQFETKVNEENYEGLLMVMHENCKHLSTILLLSEDIVNYIGEQQDVLFLCSFGQELIRIDTDALGLE